MNSFAALLCSRGVDHGLVDFVERNAANPAEFWTRCPRPDWFLAACAGMGVDGRVLVGILFSALIGIVDVTELKADVAAHYACMSVSGWLERKLNADLHKDLAKSWKDLAEAPRRAGILPSVRAACCIGAMAAAYAIHEVEPRAHPASAAAHAAMAAVLNLISAGTDPTAILSFSREQIPQSTFEGACVNALAS